MRSLFIVSLFLLSAICSAQAPKLVEVYFASHFADVLHELKTRQLKAETIKKLKANASHTELFKEIVPDIERIENVSKLDGTLISFTEKCEIPEPDEKSSNLRKELLRRLSEYCHVRFLRDYFKGSKLNSMNELQYNILRKWMIHYFKGEELLNFKVFLMRIEPNSPLQREVSFLITEQAIQNKIYPPEEILSFVDIDRNLDIHVRRIVKGNGVTKKYFTDEFSRLAGKLNDKLDAPNKEAVLDYTQRFQTYYSENKEYIDPEVAWKNLLFSGRKLLLKDYDDQAFSLLKVAAESDVEDQKQEAYFYQILGYLLNKAPDKALRFIEENKLQERFSTLSSKLKYWLAATYQANSQNKKAEDAYLQLIQNSPLTFYSIMGMKALIKLNPKYTKELLKDSFLTGAKVIVPHQTQFPIESQKCFERLSLWLEKDLEGLALFEIADLQKSSSADLHYALIKMLTDKKHYLLSFKVASNAFDLGILKADKKLLEILFPSHLLPLVRTHSNIDPFLILALIRQESAFNSKAFSSAGAQGLMQLLPKTAKRFRRGINKKNLFDPKLNIQAGSKYFAHLLALNNGNLVLALASYNAGEGRVSEWKKSLFTLEDPLLLIESIPYKETRDYVKLIYRNLFYYKLLFNQFDANTNDESFQVVWKKN